jgi:cation diffusion facilitator family transporter
MSAERSPHAESKIAVVAAILGNVAIAAVKFLAAAVTGSSAMIAEGIHSLVDTGNGGLLLLGIRKSGRRPDRSHPFGYGKELYFWSFIVAISVFGIGGGMSLYEGIVHLQHPSPMKDPLVNYIVLGASTLFESVSFTVAYRQFRKGKRGRSTIRAIREGKDPSMFTVVFEDSAALAGLVIAFLGVFLGHQFHNPYFDGGASVAIGVLLASVALWLAAESKGLLLGESADAALVEDVERLVDEDEAVVRSGKAMTMHFGPSEILLNLGVEFVSGLPAEEIHAAIHRMERRIRGRYPEIRQIYIEVESFHRGHVTDPVRAGHAAEPETAPVPAASPPVGPGV